MSNELKRYELTGVLWREYEWFANDGAHFGAEIRTYRIKNPVAFYWHEGATTHRVLDAEDVVHIVPAPGQMGCVLRYKKEEGIEPVMF